MLRFRGPRSGRESLVREVESALGTCTAVAVLRERQDADALDGVVTELRAQADLLGGSDDPADAAEVASIERLEARIVTRRLALDGIDPREVRRRSLAELAPAGLAPSPERMPPMLEGFAGRRRDADAAVERVRALMAVLHAVHGASALDVGTTLRDRGLLPWSTPQERAFLALLHQRGPDDHEVAAYRAWIGRRVEGLHALGWALGLLPELGPVGFSDVRPEAFAAAGPASPAGAPAEVVLRGHAELVSRLDVLTCAHRAVQEHELRPIAAPLPLDVVPGAIAERRRALEWLLGTDSWDDIDLDIEVRAGRGH